MEIIYKSFEELSTQELFELYHLRTQVFVVEQNCAYQEVDKHDLNAVHVLGKVRGELVACARILPGETAYPQASIGRVAVKQVQRGHGLARALFTDCLAHAREIFPGQELKVQAQCYLEKFYQSFGFRTVSEAYPDAGIMHVDMIL